MTEPEPKPFCRPCAVFGLITMITFVYILTRLAGYLLRTIG